MTLDDAIAQRDAILQNLGVSKSQYQGRSIEYPAGDARIKELLYLEDMIGRLQSQAQVNPDGSTGGSSRCTLATFRRC